MLEAPLFAFMGAFILNFLLTPYLIRILRRRSMLDIPNERSSHETPVPRGGGVVVVFAWVVGMLATWALRFPLPDLGILAPDGFVISTTLGVVVLAVLGFVDDRVNLNPFLKLFVQVAVGLQAMWFSGLRVTTLGLPLEAPLELGGLGWLIGLIWLVGFTNVFNFMDGINGLAFTQLIIGGSAFCLFGVKSGDYELAISGALAAGAALGILKYNFPKALVFMGDVGSLPSGFLLAMLGLRVAFGDHSGEKSLLVPVLALWPFLYDGGYTLLNRLFHRRNPFHAHRSHLYQRLVVKGYSHQNITAAYALWMVACGTAAYVLPSCSLLMAKTIVVGVVIGSVVYTVVTVMQVRASMT
ncbi:MAG: UDP-GlcNAc:undecaprenyl-phosphate GlcNAc-1-phosphate transferase [Candidatus Krumholzibacteriia bacterium]